MSPWEEQSSTAALPKFSETSVLLLSLSNPSSPLQALYYDALLASGLLTEPESQFIVRATAGDSASNLTFRPRFKGRQAQEQYRCGKTGAGAGAVQVRGDRRRSSTGGGWGVCVCGGGEKVGCQIGPLEAHW